MVNNGERREIRGAILSARSCARREQGSKTVILLGDERMSDTRAESPARNDSSISSASQLLEDPSPVSWAFASPLNDLEFTLKRQRGIRRKRPRKDADQSVVGKRAKRTSSSLVEAVNPNVKKLALDERDPKDDGKRQSWDKSMDELQKSLVTTPPLIATVRRCLKFSPELPSPNCRGSIEIECSLVAERIHVRGERNFRQGNFRARWIRARGSLAWSHMRQLREGVFRGCSVPSTVPVTYRPSRRLG